MEGSDFGKEGLSNETEANSVTVDGISNEVEGSGTDVVVSSDDVGISAN